MTNNIEFIQEVASFYKADNWFTEDFSKGWTTDLLTGKKVRVKKEDHESALRAQGYMMMEYTAMMEREAAEAEQAATSEEPTEGIKVVIGGKPAPETAKPAAEPKKTPAKPAAEVLNTIVIAEDIVSSGVKEQVQLTEKLANHLEEVVAKGKQAKVVEIKCADCGTPRVIKVQDVFQVKRCESCQKKHRNAKRAERRRQRKAESKGE